MGGKKKSSSSSNSKATTTTTNQSQQGARTKNNARPSSSGRSSNLLSNVIGGKPTIGNTVDPSVNDALSDDAMQFTVFPRSSKQPITSTGSATTSTVINPQLNIDSQIEALQITIRKMKKKDVITKIRALEEFVDVVRKSDVNVIKAILPQWAIVYLRLAIDHNQMIRVNTQIAQCAVVLVCGKQIAPYLKQIAPVWIASQFDSFSPTAGEHARTALQTSFLPHKFKELLIFCENEIIDYIEKNLLTLPANGFSNYSEDPEDSKRTYEYIISTTLKLYALFLSELEINLNNDNTNNNPVDKHMKILSDGKFWNYHKHSSKLIRIGWFETIAAFLNKHKGLIVPQYEVKLIKTIVESMDEQQHLVIPNLWNTLFLSLDNIPNWHTLISMEKAFLPKLWKVLKNAGYDSATFIFPHLIFLIEKLRNGVFEMNKLEKFYIDYLDCIKVGMHTNNHRPLNIEAISMAYFQSIHFILSDINNGIFVGADPIAVNAFCSKILEQHTMELIRSCFTTNLRFRKQIFTGCMYLIKTLTETKLTNVIHGNFVNKFWTSLYLLCESILHMQGIVIDPNECIKRQLEFIEILKNLNKVKRRVTFQEDDKVEVAPSVISTMDSSTQPQEEQNSKDKTCIATPVTNPMDADLNELGYKLSVLYMLKVVETKNKLYIIHLESLMKYFESEEYFQKLSGNNNSIISLYDKFSVWLLMSEDLRIENCVDILLIMYKYLDPNNGDKLKVINNLLKFPKEKVRFWMLHRVLSYPLCTDLETLNYFATDFDDNVHDLLVICAKRIIDPDQGQFYLNMLHKSFFLDDTGNLFIDNRTSEAIIYAILDLMVNLKSTELHTCTSFLTQIVPIVSNESELKPMRNLLFTKFLELQFTHFRDKELPSDTLLEVKAVWQDMITQESPLCWCLYEEFERLIKEKMSIDLSVEMLEEVADIAFSYIQCTKKASDRDHVVMKKSYVDLVISNIFQIDESHLEYLQSLCSFLQTINMDLTFRSNIINGLDEYDYMATNNGSHALKKVFKLSIIHLNIMRKSYLYNKTVIQQAKKTQKLHGNMNNNNNNNRDALEDCEDCDEDEDENSNATENVDDDYDDDDDDDDNDNDDDDDDNSNNNNSKETYVGKKKRENTSTPAIKKYGAHIQSQESFDRILNCMVIGSYGDILLERCDYADDELRLNCLQLSNTIMDYLSMVTEKYRSKVKKEIYKLLCDGNLYYKYSLRYIAQINPTNTVYVKILNDIRKVMFVKEDGRCHFLEIYQFMEQKMDSKLLPMESYYNEMDRHMIQTILYNTCLIRNYFRATIIENTTEEHAIVVRTCSLLDLLFQDTQPQKDYLMANFDLKNSPYDAILQTVISMNFIFEAVEKFPFQISPKCWNLIRLRLSVWILIIAKSLDEFEKARHQIYFISVFKLYRVVSKVMQDDRAGLPLENKNAFITLLDEWENVFCAEVDGLIIKLYMGMVKAIENKLQHKHFMDIISKQIINISLKKCLSTGRIDRDTSIDSLFQFCLEHLSHEIHSVAWVCCNLLKELGQVFVHKDMNYYKDNINTIESIDKWHQLHDIKWIFTNRHKSLQKYLENFSIKSQEYTEDKVNLMPTSIVKPFLFIWDYLLCVCEKAPTDLRAHYVSFITKNELEVQFFKTIFRMLPNDIMKNFENKLSSGIQLFQKIEWKELISNKYEENHIQYACNLYIRLLRVLPTVARKYWQNLTAGQKVIVEKVTTNYVSEQLHQLEFDELSAKRDLDSVVEIELHPTIREIVAYYPVDEKHMEIILTLPINYPYGQIGICHGRVLKGSELRARELSMHLSIFLTNQNGSIWDAIMLWKTILDKKFQGVEECFICYSVMHNETSQIPKQACKSCKKKFHGPCLFKWFSTSNRSTCPICRNIF